MTFSTRILPALALLLAAVPAAGDGVDHYDLAPSVMRANGQPIYPSGVNDPARVNPPAPPPESAIPIPPAPGAPGGPASPSNAVLGPPTNCRSWTPPAAASTQVYPPTVMPTQVYPPAIVPPQIYPPPAVPTPVYPSAAAVTPAGPLTQASWYARVDYFHWNERSGGADFVNEDGALTTLGYTRQIGIERFRAELFGGTVHYQGYDQSGSGDLIPMSSNTGYLGVRGEYEVVLSPAAWEGRWAVLVGAGTRFWIRDLHDGSDDQGNSVYGYQETWWTMYPFVGLESHWRVGDEWEWYSDARIGATALTYQAVSISDRPLWPKMNVFANAEIGLRGPRFFIAARTEVMKWDESSDVQGSLQPNSLMVTVGGQAGFVF